jgi:hypothetical protein
MALGIEQLDDFVASYLQKYIMGKWQDISSPLQEYYFASRLFDSKNKREMSTSMAKWKLKVRNNSNFQSVGLYHKDSSDRVNVLEEGNLKWALTTTNYHYDIDEEVFTKGADQIVDYMNLQEQGLMQDFFEGMEDLMFGPGPTGPTQSPFTPASLLWWITSTMDSVTENNAPEGFHGAEPIGWAGSGVGGISTTKYDQWRNRTFPYTVVDRDDFVEKVINSMDLCSFKPPVTRSDIKPEGNHRWELLTTHSRIAESRRLLQLGNDNIRDDLAAHSGSVMIRGVPMTWVPAWTNSASLNARNDGIILGVDWNTFDCYYASGRSQRKRKPFQHPEMSNVRVRAMDDSLQTVCYNRRANFRGYCTETVTETT